MTPASPTGHILVVEPNDITRKLIVGILNNKGYETYEAVGGTEAGIFLNKDLMLVILDVEDDNMDNIGFIRKMQMEHSRLPLVALTENPDRKALQEKLGLSDVSVLQKPVMPDKLLSNIQAHLLGGIQQKIDAEIKPVVMPGLSLSDKDPEIQAKRKAHMTRAIDLSQEMMDKNIGGPFGAVIVKGGRIIAEGWNEVTSSNDPTAHAEMQAIRKAAAAIGDYKLEGCEIYTSCEPCPMCLSALYWARIDRIFYGNTREDAERIGFDDDFIYRELAQPEHKRTLGAKMFMREESKIVFENWVKKGDKTPY